MQRDKQECYVGQMPNRKALIAGLAVFLTSNTLVGQQQPRAIANDPAPNKEAPAQNLETALPSNGSKLLGIFMLASGTEPHKTAIMLHGFPGYEQNMDLSQALRRDGWNLLAMHYRGSWGSEGSFSFTHCIEDVGEMLAYLTLPANAAKYHVNTREIVVIGHSMGGFLAVAALAQHPEIAAGVIITEGSPINDGAGYFGKESDPADYLPLAGTSPAALERESKAKALTWGFDALAPKIAPRPVLVLSANDGLRASNETLTAALRRAGSPVTYVHMDTDHGFGDHRIALESTVLQWLEKTLK